MTPDEMTVEMFLRDHPHATLDILSSLGFIYLTPEQGAALLNGGKAYTHPGVFASGIFIDANDILVQTFLTLEQDEKDPNLFHALTDFPAETQEESAAPQFGTM